MIGKDKVQKTEKECDECGRGVVKICRIHKEHRYCATCYARVFKRRICPKCGNFARLPKNDPEAVCLKCQRNRPCARCGKVEYKIGRITPYGPVCNACAPHFREPEPCELCGRPSLWLSRVTRLDHVYRVCPRCARTDLGTCVACRRHRRLQESPDGRLLCKACLEKGEVSCPKCGEPMPAGYGKQCPRCYWLGLLEKRIRIDCAAFSTPPMVAHFEAFGQWLGRKVGEKKAALTIHRYLQFFMDIEKQWKAIPGFSTLLAHFGTLSLRRVLLPMRWMEECGLVAPVSSAKEEDSDRRRIEVILERFPKGSREATILVGYHKAMVESLKEGKTTLRSIRLGLSPATALLLKAREMKCMTPEQKALDAYLDKTPGQRAAVSGFVRYLRNIHGAEIALPKVDTIKAERNRRRKLELEMLQLMSEGGEGEEFRRRWLSVALAYFHGLPKKVGRMVSSKDIVLDDSGMSVIVDGSSYWIPKPRTQERTNKNSSQYESLSK